MKAIFIAIAVLATTFAAQAGTKKSCAECCKGKCAECCKTDCKSCCK